MSSIPALSDPAATLCAKCGTEIASGILACPGCLTLIHSEQLKNLGEQAADASRVGDRDAELTAWNHALTLLPVGSRQHATVSNKIAALSSSIEPTPTPQPQSRVWKRIVGLGPAGIFLWKMKFLAVALLTNGKVLLLGLTKASTFFSMLLAFGVYWTAWGMWFALGLVLSIYVHEMGHVVALRRYGIAATAPMFVPGLGAFIRLRQASLPPSQNARVGLAGPAWGLGAASAAWAMSKLGAGPMWAAIAHTGAWINIFNLLPVWQLDGNRAFSALGRQHRWSIGAAFGIAWLATGDGLLALLAIAASVRALDPAVADESDVGVWVEFLLLIAGLVILMRLSPSTRP
jgi:Zn-dependent protease